MSAEPPFEQFNVRGRSRPGWLWGEPTPRESFWLGLILAVLALLPVFVAQYPQMVDYPAHLARYHVMLNRDSSALLKEYYGFQWRWSGNLGADLLIIPLAKLMSLEAAGKVIVYVTVLLNGLGVLAVEWSLRRRIGIGGLLGLLFVWSPAMLLGFLNFGLSLAAALFAFALWVRLDGWKWRAPLFMPIGLVVWLCHVSGWGTLGVMVFGYEWHKDKSWRAFVAPWPLTLPFVALIGLSIAGEKSGGELYSYGKVVGTYKWAIWRQAMRDTWRWLDYGTLIGIGVVLVGSFGLKRLDGRLGWAAIAMLVLSLVLPRHIIGGDYVDARMIYTGLMVGCLALSWRAPRLVLLLAAALFLGRLGLTTHTWYTESQRTERLLAMIDPLPQGVKIASLVETEIGVWPINPQEHIAGYAVVRKDALVNMHFALPLIHMLTINEGGKFFRDPYHRLLWKKGRKTDMTTYAPARYVDWFWYIGRHELDALPSKAKVTLRTDEALLARMPPPRPERGLAKPPGDS